MQHMHGPCMRSVSSVARSHVALHRRIGFDALQRTRVHGIPARTVQLDVCKNDVATIRLNDTQPSALYDVEVQIVCNVVCKFPATLMPQLVDVHSHHAG
eukprot:356090-Chlamydomonas_euryale.AAC.2